jgi:hypothetical protein
MAPLVHLTACRVIPQLDFVPFRVPQFELLTIPLRPPRRPDFVLDLDALGLQFRVELVHVRRPKHQAKMVHVGCHGLSGGTGPDVDDDLGGDPRRDETHLALAEFMALVPFPATQ